MLVHKRIFNDNKRIFEVTAAIYFGQIDIATSCYTNPVLELHNM